MQVLLTVYAVGERMPDADSDVLIFDGPGPGQLGAFVGTTDEGLQQWVDAQGGAVYGVTHWAEMPTLPVVG
jgi:hypothetical protein